MNVALIGAGRIGAMHGERLAAEDRVTELLVADAAPALAAQLVARLGEGRAVSVDDVFGAAPDAVVITAATPAHPELVARCIEREIPCFCEKPLTLEVAESVQPPAVPSATERWSRSASCVASILGCAGCGR